MVVDSGVQGEHVGDGALREGCLVERVRCAEGDIVRPETVGVGPQMAGLIEWLTWKGAAHALQSLACRIIVAEIHTASIQWEHGAGRLLHGALIEGLEAAEAECRIQGIIRKVLNDWLRSTVLIRDKEVGDSTLLEVVVIERVNPCRCRKDKIVRGRGLQNKAN
jgi:hypothetical protein